MSNTKYQPRITLDITPRQAQALRKIPWGLKRPLFEALLDDLVDTLEENNMGSVIGAIINRDVKFHIKQNVLDDGDNNKP